MRILASAAALAALVLAAAPGARAAPVNSDGGSIFGGSFGATMTMAARNAEALSAFADRADYGPVLEIVTTSTTGASAPNQKMAEAAAAALAASGAEAAARATLERLPAGDAASAWRAIASGILARRAGNLDVAARLAAEAVEREPGNAFAHNLAGTVASLKGDFEGAAAAYAEAARLGPEGGAYYANLGGVLLEQGDLELAGRVLARALELTPDDCSALIHQARLDMRGGSHAAAAEHYRACLAVRPEQQVAAIELFDAELRSNDLEGAAATLGAYRSGFPAPAFAEARLALHHGDGERAAERLKAAGVTSGTSILPAFAEAMRGEVASASGLAAAAAASRPDDVAAALARFAFAVAAGEPAPAPAPAIAETPQAALLAALAEAGDGAAAEAADSFAGADNALPALDFAGLTAADAAAIAKDGAARSIALGALFEMFGYVRPALSAYAAAANAAPDAALPRLLQARRLAPADRAGAVTAYAAAAERAPGLKAPQLALGELAAARGDFVTALTHFETAVSIEAAPRALLMTGMAAETLGQDDTAEAAYGQLVDLAPDSFVALNQYAWFLTARERDLDRAEALAERAVALRPGNAAVLDTLGRIAFLRDDIDAALARLREAHATDGGRTAIIALHLAEAEAAAGNADRALALLEPLLAEAEALGAVGEAAEALRADLSP